MATKVKMSNNTVNLPRSLKDLDILLLATHMLGCHVFKNIGRRHKTPG